MYTKQQILANPNIVIHCESEQEWEECRKEFPGTTQYNFSAFNHNAMRPGGGPNCSASVGSYMSISDSIIITYKQYKEFNTPFPEKWYIHGSKEFCAFLKSGLIDRRIANSFDGSDPDKYWGYHIGYEGKIRFKFLENIPDYKLVTIEQLIQHYTPQNMAKAQTVVTHYPNTPTNMTHTISKKQLKEIYDVACAEWQFRIKGYAAKDLFSDAVSFTEAEVKAMFDAATKGQLPILESIFTDYAKAIKIPKTREELKNSIPGLLYFNEDHREGAMIQFKDGNSDRAKASFHLHTSFNWALDGTALICTYKE